MREVALQRLMGHTDVAITLNTYTSVFNKYKESELEKVNEYYLKNSMYKLDDIKKENQKLIEGTIIEKNLEELEVDEDDKTRDSRMD